MEGDARPELDEVFLGRAVRDNPVVLRQHVLELRLCVELDERLVQLMCPRGVNVAEALMRVQGVGPAAAGQPQPEAAAAVVPGAPAGAGLLDPPQAASRPPAVPLAPVVAIPPRNWRRPRPSPGR